jgi:3'-phosphoadenosine 5'-phosphosulfate (PAPS) 3'-phosphatase
VNESEVQTFCAEPSRTDWAVHLALVERRTTEVSRRAWATPVGLVAVGAVALPAQGAVFHRPAAGRPRTRRRPALAGRCRSRQTAAFRCGASQAARRGSRGIGSAGAAKIAAVLAGDADIYSSRGWSVRMGLRGAGGGCPCSRTAHVAARRFTPRLQPARPAGA